MHSKDANIYEKASRFLDAVDEYGSFPDRDASRSDYIVYGSEALRLFGYEVEPHNLDSTDVDLICINHEAKDISFTKNDFIERDSVTDEIRFIHINGIRYQLTCEGFLDGFISGDVGKYEELESDNGIIRVRPLVLIFSDLMKAANEDRAYNYDNGRTLYDRYLRRLSLFKPGDI